MKSLVYNRNTKTFSEVKSYAYDQNKSIYALFRIDTDSYGRHNATFTGSYGVAYQVSELEKPIGTKLTKYKWVQVCKL